VTVYKIVGPQRVAGHEPGSTVTDGDLAGLNVSHLIEAGHIAPSKAAKAEPAPTNQED